MVRRVSSSVSCYTYAMQILRIIFKSGHVEKLTAKSFTVTTSLTGDFKLESEGPIGRTMPFVNKNEIVAVTFEDVADRTPSDHPPVDAAGRREDPAHDHR